jgi:hypothetical protein
MQDTMFCLTAATQRRAAWGLFAHCCHARTGPHRLIMQNALAFTIAGVALGPGDREPEHLGEAGNPRGKLTGKDRTSARHGDRGEKARSG